MQIHELPLNSGAPADTDVFALDTGSQAFKIDYNALADAILKKSLSAITSAGEYPVKSSAIYQRLLNTAWCFESVAINTSGTATRAYSVGEYVVSQQNRFYRVKQAVASGEAWAVGTNLESAFVGDILEALNTLTASHTNQITALNSNLTEHMAIHTVTDWNDFLPDGSYRVKRGFSSGGTAAHTPYSGDNASFYGISFGSTNGAYATQILVSQYSASVSNRNKIYIRSKLAGGAFSAYKEIQTI